MAFAFCHLLGFRLLPRLKDIASQKLARPEAGNPSDYEHLQPILSKPIDWDLIKNQYDEMIKFATALRLGTAETEAILRRFTRNNLQHPTYQALAELGRAIKTIFLCQYLESEELRREEVLAEGEWMKRLTKEDYRGLTPLFYSHVNPYGILRLDMTERLPIRQEAS